MGVLPYDKLVDDEDPFVLSSSVPTYLQGRGCILGTRILGCQCPPTEAGVRSSEAPPEAGSSLLWELFTGTLLLWELIAGTLFSAQLATADLYRVGGLIVSSCDDEKMGHTVDSLLPRVQQSLVLAKIDVDLTRENCSGCLKSSIAIRLACHCCGKTYRVLVGNCCC